MKEPTKLRIGILGPGGIADERLAPALVKAKGACLWSVLSRDEPRAAAFAAKHGALSPRPAHTDLEAMLADPDLDAVIIATPDKLHAPQAIAAARAGKHVLCEKPMATSVEDARAMVEACHAAKVTLGVAYHLRFHSGHQALARAIREGRLGDLRHGRVQWTWQSQGASNWRAKADVGRWWALAAVGTHGIDLLRWLMRPAGEVSEVRCYSTSDVHGGPHDETSIVTLRFSSGAIAEVLASCLFRAPRRIEITGALASALCDDTLGPHGAGKITLAGDPLSFEVEDPYLNELEDFARAARERRDPEVSGEEGLRNVEILCEARP